MITQILSKLNSNIFCKALKHLYWHEYLEATFNLLIQMNLLFSSQISIWKKDVIAFFMDKNFFRMRNCCLEKWRNILPLIFTLDTFKTFTEGLNSSQTSSFLFRDQESEKITFWQRISFTMLVCPLDTFRYHLPDLQKALVESFKSFSDDLNAESFRFLRVLLLKISPKYTIHFWALILSAMVIFFSKTID